MKSNKILVLGYGVASNAYLSLLENNNQNTIVLGSPLDKKKITRAKTNFKNFSNNFSFSKKTKFYFHNEHNKLNFNKINYIIIGTNSKGIKWVSDIIKKTNIHTKFLILTKGLMFYQKKIITISEYLKKITGRKNFVMSAGPCLANELLNKKFTQTIFSSKNILNAEKFKKILCTKYYIPEINNDLIGSEICSAIKNIYAIIIGSSLSSNKKKNLTNFNTSSYLFNQSLKEMSIITKKFGGNHSSVFGIAGVGDLYVSILGGRNSKLGSYLGENLNYKNILKNKMKNTTVEGADLVISHGKLLIKKIGRKNLPLLNSLCNSLLSNKKLNLSINS